MSENEDALREYARLLVSRAGSSELKAGSSVSDEEDGGDFQSRFFTKLATLVAPYSSILFMIHRPSFCSPRPRLVAVLTTGDGIDLRFREGTFGLMTMRGLGLPRALKKLLAPNGYLPPPVFKALDSPDVAAEKCWDAIQTSCKPNPITSDGLPPLPSEDRSRDEARLDWLDRHAPKDPQPAANKQTKSTPRRVRR